MQLMSKLYHHLPMFFLEYGIIIRAMFDPSTCPKATKSLNCMLDTFAQKVTVFGLFVENVFQGLETHISDTFTATLCNHDEECSPSVVHLDEVDILADLTDE